MPDAGARHRALTLLLLAAAGGCGGDSAASSRARDTPPATGEPVLPVVDTSGGIRTMTHDATAFDRAPQLEIDAAPVAVLGAPDDDPAYDLTHVSTVRLLADGRFATLSDIGARLLLFGSDGRGERVLARPGQGPGEVTRPESLIPVAGDSLLVLDFGNAREVRLPLDGGAPREEPIAPDTLLFRVTSIPGALDGDLPVGLVSPRARPGEEGEVAWWPCHVALLPTDGGRPHAIASVPCVETVTIGTRRRGRRRLQDAPLRLGGRGSIAVAGSLIVSGGGDRYVVDLRSRDGAIVARIAADRPRRAVTAPMREAVIARALAMFEGARSERMVDAEESRRLAREAPFADSLPPYDAILASRDGTVWIVDAIAPTDTAWSATAFRADGAIVGRLHAASRGRPMAFEGDRVAVRSEDADGIVTVRVHRVRPGPGGS